MPPGTEGAISLEGTLGGFVGGALVAAVGAAGSLYSWPIAGLVAIAGLLGSLAESVIGTVATNPAAAPRTTLFDIFVTSALCPLPFQDPHRGTRRASIT